MTGGGPRHARRRAPNAGHVAAVLVAAVAGVSVVALGVVGGIRNGLTPAEIVGGCIAIAFGAGATLWLRRESRQHDRRGQS